jgi:hypothetical protein
LRAGERARLALEAGDAIGVADERLVQDLDRDVECEGGVVGASPEPRREPNHVGNRTL